MSTSAREGRRILIVDDNPSIHRDFRKILAPAEDVTELEGLEAMIFGTPAVARSVSSSFEVDSALGGEEGLQRVQKAMLERRPYALAFVDIRMPPGMDGVETVQRLWKVEPDLQVVLCSAYSDYSWEELARQLGTNERLLILRKPFDTLEVRQMAHALCEKWELLRQSHRRMEDLEREVEERTRALAAANARLVQAQKLEALGRMSAGLAHEVNNPLSFVLSSLRHIQRELDSGEAERVEPEELKEACRDAVMGAERIARIVEDVRLFARMEAPERAPVDVRAVVEGAISLASPSLRGNIHLTKDFQEVPPVWGTEHGLGQVFVNLLVNAAQALEGRAEPSIRVTLRRQSEDLVAVEVQDNGCGISPANLARLFEPFFTTKPVGKGMGLGLSICHGIVTRLGGDIVVDSAPERGTTFRVLLPRAEASTTATHGKAPEEPEWSA